MRPTVRLRLTVLYAGVLFVSGALLLGVTYVLVRNSLHPSPEQLSPLSPDQRELTRTATRELADDALADLRIQLALALGALTVLSLLLGWVVAGRALRPLQRITATAQRVSQDSLDERIALQGPQDELKELADTFDAMLARLSHAFTSQRRFVANASHELRTPLTVMRTELEVTLGDPRAGTAELRAMAETVRVALARTERLIEALLTLARSESTLTGRERVDLADAARLALDQVGTEAASGALHVTADLDEATVRGDRRLLERLVANLVENAVRHNVAGGALHVRTLVDGERALVVVDNDGDRVAADALPTLLEPFQRLDRGARGDGAGLGLSIVRSVAAAHGGHVGLHARPTGGLRASVELPHDRAGLPRPRPDRVGAAHA